MARAVQQMSSPDAGSLRAGAALMVTLTGGKGNLEERKAALKGVDYTAACKECSQGGAVGAALGVLMAPDADVIAATDACAVVRNIAGGSGLLAQEVVHARGIHTLCAAMERFDFDRHLALFACGA